MSAGSLPIASEWGEFKRATTTFSDGEVLVYDWYVLEAEPELVLRTVDAVQAEELLARVGAFFTDRTGWQRRATDAIVARFSDTVPTPTELDEAAEDLVLATVEAWPGGSVVLHFDDGCGEHFGHGYWPAVRFDQAGVPHEVTVES